MLMTKLSPFHFTLIFFIPLPAGPCPPGAPRPHRDGASEGGALLLSGARRPLPAHAGANMKKHRLSVHRKKSARWPRPARPGAEPSCLLSPPDGGTTRRKHHLMAHSDTSGRASIPCTHFLVKLTLRGRPFDRAALGLSDPAGWALSAWLTLHACPSVRCAACSVLWRGGGWPGQRMRPPWLAS